MDILLFIQENLRCAAGDFLFPLITRLGDAGLIWIILGLSLLISRKTRRCGLAILISLAVTYAVGDLVIKNLIMRPRPFTVYPEIELLISPPGSFSFPSGHSGSSFAAATALFCFYKKPGIAALVLAALIAFSRMYLFVHYPTDVLAGSMLGIFMALAVCCFLRKSAEPASV